MIGNNDTSEVEFVVIATKSNAFAHVARLSLLDAGYYPIVEKNIESGVFGVHKKYRSRHYFIDATTIDFSKISKEMGELKAGKTLPISSSKRKRRIKTSGAIKVVVYSGNTGYGFMFPYADKIIEEGIDASVISATFWGLKETKFVRPIKIKKAPKSLINTL
jgi:hypothetical protein